MTIEQLFEQLDKYPKDTEVLCESDSSAVFYGTLTVTELDGMPVIASDLRVKYNERITSNRSVK